MMRGVRWKKGAQADDDINEHNTDNIISGARAILLFEFGRKKNIGILALVGVCVRWTLAAAIYRIYRHLCTRVYALWGRELANELIY